MSTHTLPYFFEDTTGHVFGPADFLDIYERPPFLRVESVMVQRRQLSASRMDTAIFELGAHTFVRSAQRREIPPSAVISFDGVGLRGSIRFRAGLIVQLDRWLKKSTTFGSTLTRQFKTGDGMSYEWSFRQTREHEWVCRQLGSERLVAHYDLKPAGERSYRRSGNVLTIYQNWIHLAVEIVASLVVMRRIYADISEDPLTPQ